jgi:hypothetical protein
MNSETLEEIEALTLIYQDGVELRGQSELNILIEPFPGESNEVAVRLNVFLPSEYPQELPSLSIKPLYDLDSSHLGPLNTIAESIAERDRGSAMIFDIIEGIREYLQTSLSEPENAKNQIVHKTYATCTPVTAQTFSEWKARYEAEKKRLKEEEEERIRNLPYINGLTYQEVWSKPTGYEIFSRRTADSEEVSEEPSDEEAEIEEAKSEEELEEIDAELDID